MNVLINLLEATISTYGLSELCNIKNKKFFYIANILITFIVTQFFDYIDANFLPLTVIDAVVWYIVVCIFTKKQFVYNLFMVILVNMFCGICAVLPIMFVYHYNRILAGFAAKIIQFCLTYGFIKFKKRYTYLENKHLFMIILIIFFCDCISGFQDELIVNNTYTINNILTNIFVIIIICITLFFFYLIEDSIIEKERIAKKYEEQKYQNLTYDFMKSTKDELNRLEHKMTYQILLIQDFLDKGYDEKARQMINHYIDDIHRVNHTIFTGNELLDASLTLKMKDLSYDVVPCFTISKNAFYDNVQFVNLILDLLDEIKTKNINFILKEENGFCIVQCTSKNMIIQQDDIQNILANYSDLMCRYKLSQQNDIHILTLKVGMITL